MCEASSLLSSAAVGAVGGGSVERLAGKNVSTDVSLSWTLAVCRWGSGSMPSGGATAKPSAGLPPLGGLPGKKVSTFAPASGCSLASLPLLPSPRVGAAALLWRSQPLPGLKAKKASRATATARGAVQAISNRHYFRSTWRAMGTRHKTAKELRQICIYSVSQCGQLCSPAPATPPMMAPMGTEDDVVDGALPEDAPAEVEDVLQRVHLRMMMKHPRRWRLRCHTSLQQHGGMQ